jgi:hypothetical protein
MKFFPSLRRRLAFSLVALSLSGVAGAMTYVPVTDASMVDRSALVIVGRVERLDGTGDRYTAYHVAVDRVLKGSLSSRSISVVVPGSDTFIVPGMPKFYASQRVILFLAPRPDGTYALVELTLGAFKEQQVKGSQDTRAERDLKGTNAVGDLKPEPSRDFDGFANWIANRAAGDLGAGNYIRSSAELLAPSPERVVAPFTFLENPTPARWTEFDTGGSVPWVVRLGVGASASTMAGGGVTVFQTVLAAYNAEPKAIFNFTYAGTTTAPTKSIHCSRPGVPCSGNDQLNTLFINDPFEDITGAFTGSGVLAIGGYSRGLTTHNYKNSAHFTILEGDMVTQNGADTFFLLFSGTAGAQVMAHEMGHVVGLGHSCGDSDSPACNTSTKLNDAMMRASAHNDDRGARFGEDDVDAFVRLYERTVPLPTLPTVSVANVSQNEGHTGNTLMYFTATLSSAPTAAVTVSYTTSNGTATSGSDYTARTGTLTYAVGQTTRQLIVTVTGDTTTESNETFNVTLSSPVGATLGTATAVGTIANDDTPAASVPINQFRLYSPITLEHLFTTDENEYNVLGTRGWTQEGLGYKMLSSAGPFSGTFPVPFYRLYHGPSLQHHWTTDANEVTTLAERTDWTYEGIIGFILPTQAGTSIPLFRLVLGNPLIHLWTTDSNEKLVLTTQRGWGDEGIPGYVIP